MSQPSRVYLDPVRTISKRDKRLFGAFLEHMGRAVYGGVYDPESPLSDSDGIRQDVVEAVKDLGVPIVRYPGGNFVSGYHWMDGVGPKEQRPTVIEKAWNSLETNQFGTNEFMAWCKKVGAEPLLAVNLGTGSPEEAANYLEYCNSPVGTKYSDLRAEHGFAEPHNVKTWCLGNEMDGPWQIGYMSPTEYARKARNAAHMMRIVDKDVELIACGSSNPSIETFVDWDRQVLEIVYDDVDAISLHLYYDNKEMSGEDSSRYLALNLLMDQQIKDVIAAADYVRARKRSKKRLWLAFDEWNVWYRDMKMDGERQIGPRLLEEIYNLEDALLVGGSINTLLRNSNRVRIGCLAQLVNVIAPIMTNSKGLFKQTIYYPFAWAIRHAGPTVLDLYVDSPTYSVEGVDEIPYIDAAGTFCPKTGAVSLFVLNRDLENEREIEFVNCPESKVLDGHSLSAASLKVANTFDQPDNVRPELLDAPSASFTFKVPPRSYSVIRLGLC